MADLTPSTLERGLRTRPPGPLGQQLIDLADVFARSQHDLVVVAAEFADSAEWVLAGYANPANWLADIADVESCTAREWIRIGRRVRELPAITDAFGGGTLSYSKVRTLTRYADLDNEAELGALAASVPASDLGRVLARWMNNTMTDKEIVAHHRKHRSIKWRTEPDGMVTFTLRLPPRIAATLIAVLTALVMRARTRPDASGGYPTLAQQYADALENFLTNGAGTINTEVVLHVRGDGATCDDGTPIADSVISKIAPDAFIRALIHDANGRPINASRRQRHPSTRQKRVVKERDQTCIDCGRAELLEYDHNPAYQQTNHTITEELELRCAPCHHQRHCAA